MENKKIIIARCALSLAAMLAMLSCIAPTLAVRPTDECDACKDAIKAIKQHQNEKQSNVIATWRCNDA